MWVYDAKVAPESQPFPRHWVKLLGWWTGGGRGEGGGGRAPWQSFWLTAWKHSSISAATAAAFPSAECSVGDLSAHGAQPSLQLWLRPKETFSTCVREEEEEGGALACLARDHSQHVRTVLLLAWTSHCMFDYVAAERQHAGLELSPPSPCWSFVRRERVSELGTVLLPLNSYPADRLLPQRLQFIRHLWHTLYMFGEGEKGNRIFAPVFPLPLNIARDQTTFSGKIKFQPLWSLSQWQCPTSSLFPEGLPLYNVQMCLILFGSQIILPRSESFSALPVSLVQKRLPSRCCAPLFCKLSPGSGWNGLPGNLRAGHLHSLHLL